MATPVNVVAGLTALLAATAGYAVVSRCRRRTQASDEVRYDMSEEERRSLELLRALDANTTEAGINGGSQGAS